MNKTSWTCDDAWQCGQLVIKLAMLIDRERLDEIDTVFLPDAITTAMGQEQRGIAAIRSLFRDRLAGAVVRHVLSPSLIEPDNDGATGVTYVTVYKAPAAAGPLPLTGPEMVAEYRDRFVRSALGWRIARRDVELTFRRG